MPPAKPQTWKGPVSKGAGLLWTLQTVLVSFDFEIGNWWRFTFWSAPRQLGFATCSRRGPGMARFKRSSAKIHSKYVQSFYDPSIDNITSKEPVTFCCSHQAWSKEWSPCPCAAKRRRIIEAAKCPGNNDHEVRWQNAQSQEQIGGQNLGVCDRHSFNEKCNICQNCQNSDVHPMSLVIHLWLTCVSRMCLKGWHNSHSCPSKMLSKRLLPDLFARRRVWAHRRSSKWAVGCYFVGPLENSHWIQVPSMRDSATHILSNLACKCMEVRSKVPANSDPKPRKQIQMAPFKNWTVYALTFISGRVSF